jgi:hypothetical protein
LATNLLTLSEVAEILAIFNVSAIPQNEIVIRWQYLGKKIQSALMAKNEISGWRIVLNLFWCYTCWLSDRFLVLSSWWLV